MKTSELQSILEGIEVKVIDCKGDSVHREALEIPIRWVHSGPNTGFIFTDVIVTSSCIPSKPINDGGHLVFEEQEVKRVIAFEYTSLWMEEDIAETLTNTQKDLVEEHLESKLVFE